MILIMNEIDSIFTERPEYGKRRMSFILRERGFDVGVRLTRSLMQQMGLEAVGPKPNLSKPHPNHKIYPYGLKGVKIYAPNQAWSTDITYIPMRNGFLYLTAVMDWYSRYILSWRLSNSLDGLFCREALLEALANFGKPQWFNTDQGAQFTSLEFISILEMHGIQISMDGRGRALDNVWIERFWRTVKYEEIYLKSYIDGLDAMRHLSAYIAYYNERRPHSALAYKPPCSIYRL